MKNDAPSYVKCPYCEEKISSLTFTMIDVEEERFSDERLEAMKTEIQRLREELANNPKLDSTKKVLYKNRIEHFEMELGNEVVRYKERVYYCPSCKKILTVIPTNDIMSILELVSSAAFDVRKLK